MNQWAHYDYDQLGFQVEQFNKQTAAKGHPTPSCRRTIKAVLGNQREALWLHQTNMKS